MAATDDELQKLSRPPIYSGKEDEWNEWSFVMESYVSLLSVHTAALLTGTEDPASPDMSMSRIRTTLTNGIEAAQKLFHVLVMNVRGPALIAIRGTTDMNAALAWRMQSLDTFESMTAVTSVLAAQRAVSSRCDRIARQQERVKRHGVRCLDKRRQ